MTPNRRELLGSLGVASASALLWATGCRTRGATALRDPLARDDVRTWLRDAVARLAVVYPSVHALAVTRVRTTAALDVLGIGVARARRDGVVLGVRTPDGGWREQVTSELTEKGVAAAVTALVGRSTQRARVDFPAPPPPPRGPKPLGDLALKARVEALHGKDRRTNSRIVYAASLIEIDDATVWSLAPRHDREQRLVRVRKHVLRAAWAGTSPVIGEAERGWRGGVDDHDLAVADVERAADDALLLTTPGGFDEDARVVVLDPGVTARLADAAARAVLTTAAARRPEVARRLAIGATLAASPLTLIDDPTTGDAYGGFAFDDEGQPATKLTLVDHGRVVGVLADGGRGRGRRPGHVGRVEPAPSHLRITPGIVDALALRGDGFVLDGGHATTIDPATDRVVIGAARARELKAGVETGRVFADVELVGELAPMLASIDGIAQQHAIHTFRDEVDGEPRWRSVDAPFVRLRGVLRQRRRLA